MERQIAVESLRRHAADLQDRGVRHLSVFGSTARGEAEPESDIDLLVDIDARASHGLTESIRDSQKA